MTGKSNHKNSEKRQEDHPAGQKLVRSVEKIKKKKVFLDERLRILFATFPAFLDKKKLGSQKREIQLL
jgi:hypothetical protein